MIRSMLHSLAAACVLLLVVGLSFGNGYSNGYVADGYTYNNGYWYLGSQAYTRQLWTRPAYYTYSGYCNSCRTYVPEYSYYVYTPYYGQTQQYYAPKVDYKDPGWRSKLLDIAAARDKVEGDIRKGAFEQQYFLDGVAALGLQGNFRVQGYGQAAPYGYGSSPLNYGYAYQQTTNYGVSAGTQYGYQANASYTQLSNPYGDANLNQLFQQAAQLTSNAQRLGGEANQGFQQLVGTVSTGRDRVAEILAKGQMAQQILNSLTTGPTSETRGISFTVKQGVIEKVEDPKQVTDEQRSKLLEAWGFSASKRCLKCHDEKEHKGGFVVKDYPKMTPEQKNKVWLTLTTPDDKKAMPRNDQGGVDRLPPDELRLWFVN